jgi:hypothetical protein
MDYLAPKKQRYDISNNWWYLPQDVYQIETNKSKSSSSGRDSGGDNNGSRKFPLVDYIEHISQKDKFRFLVIIIIVVVFVYHIQLHSSVWVGLILAIIISFYINEKETREVNSDADQLWTILKGDLLKDTKYFITDPQLIRWVNDIGELKRHNVLEFNKMIKSLDQLLRLMYDVKRGIRDLKDTFDIFKDLKVSCTNQFHSIIHKISIPAVRRKHGYHLTELGNYLNDRHTKLLRIDKLYYNNNPINIDSHFGEPTLNDPVPIDTAFDSRYNFYN